MLNQKRRQFFKNNIFLVIFGIIAFLVLLEISLRLSGGKYHIIRTHGEFSLRSRNTQNRNSFIILCLGDSYTYGAGAPFEYSYPRQLEKMLNEGRIEKKVNVQNLGSPGGNSYRILKIFRENINKYNPEIAIIMVGTNNDWNLEGMQRFSQSYILKKTKFDIYDLRIYKLWKILTMSLSKKIAKTSQEKLDMNNQLPHQKNLTHKKESVTLAPQAQIPVLEWGAYKKKVDSFREADRSDLAIEEINNMLKKYPGAYQLQGELVLFLREMGNYDLALEYAKKTLAGAPLDQQQNAYMHMELVYIYRAKKYWDLARKEMDYALEDISYIQSVFPELVYICNNKESGLDFTIEAEKIRKLISTIHGEKGIEIWDTLLYLEKNQEEKFRIVEADLLELINIARKNNIKLILMTYPIWVSANEVIRKVALKYNIPLIDNELIFKEKPNKEEFLNLDSHCNAKGYEMVAANIYSTLFRIRVLPRE